MSRRDGRGLYFVNRGYEENQPCAATNCRPETHVRSYRRCGQPVGPKILLVLPDHYTRAKGCAETSVSTKQSCVTFHNRQRLSYTEVKARHLAHCQIDHPNCTNCLPEVVRCRVGSSARAITIATVRFYVFFLSPSGQLPAQYLKCCTVAVTQAINKPSKNLTEIISSFASTGEQYASERQLSRSVSADAGFLGEKATMLGGTIKWTRSVGNICSSGL